MTDNSVLVLNADGWELLARTRLSRALALVAEGKAVLHEVRDDKLLRFSGGEMLWPTVIRLVNYVRIKLNRSPAKYSKRDVLVRDGFRCAYSFSTICLGVANTVDHIHPVSQGGQSVWKNVVGACKPCNNEKADRAIGESWITSTGEHVEAKLLFEPWIPTKHQLSALRK